MGATQQCCALAACNAACAKASRVSQGEPLAVVRVKGFAFEGCAVGLRKQGDAAVRHRAIYVHEEQFDLRGTLPQRRGDSGKAGQKKPSKTSIYPRSNFLPNSIGIAEPPNTFSTTMCAALQLFFREIPLCWTRIARGTRSASRLFRSLSVDGLCYVRVALSRTGSWFERSLHVPRKLSSRACQLSLYCSVRQSPNLGCHKDRETV